MQDGASGCFLAKLRKRFIVVETDGNSSPSSFPFTPEDNALAQNVNLTSSRHFHGQDQENGNFRALSNATTCPEEHPAQ